MIAWEIKNSIAIANSIASILFYCFRCNFANFAKILVAKILVAKLHFLLAKLH